jgi:hypothetical protein
MVKQRIESKEVWKNKPLQDDHAIGSYQIEKGSILDLVTPLPPVSIEIKTPSGKRITAEVRPSDSVRSLKQQIEQKESL